MFTLEEIQAAHSKVKSGADFPAYISELKQLGVQFYETFVSDGLTDYSSGSDSITSLAKYYTLSIADKPNPEQFKADLKTHQQGKTDYLTFCSDCAKSGIEKWTVDINKLTCTYYDKDGNKIYMENVPST